MIKGVIFDFDGTIVDSEISRLYSLNKILEKNGFKYTITDEEWNLKYRRLRSIDILRDIKEKNNFNYDENIMYEESHKYREKIEKKGVKIIKGFLNFYNFLKNNNIKMIIASGGKREHIKLIMKVENLPKIEIIGREDYIKSKPSPDCYLLALKKLNLNPNEVIIFDDSYSGLLAGILTKCKVIAINSFDPDINELEIFKKFKNYDEINFEKFLNY